MIGRLNIEEQITNSLKRGTTQEDSKHRYTERMETIDQVAKRKADFDNVYYLSM